MDWLLKEKAVVIFNLVSQVSFFKQVHFFFFLSGSFPEVSSVVFALNKTSVFLKEANYSALNFCFSLEHIVLLRILYGINNSKLWLTFWEEKLVYSSSPTLQSRTSFVIFSFFRPQVCLTIKNYMSYSLLFWSILELWRGFEGLFFIFYFFWFFGNYCVCIM